MYNLHSFAADVDMSVEEIIANENGELQSFYDCYATDVAFGYEDTIQSLIHKVGQDNFYQEFDDALVRISSKVENELFNIETADGTKKGFIRANYNSC